LSGFINRGRLEMSRNLVTLAVILFLVAVCTSSAPAQLPDIQKGTISVYLQSVASGMAAPDYGISPPGDTSRLFVVEQNGLLRIINNGVLQPGSALNMQSRVSPPFNAGNANDERGFLGLAFHPGFNNDSSVGYRTLYTYASEPVGTGVTYPAPNGASQTFKLVINEWKMSAVDPNVVDPLSRREVFSIGHNAGNHNGGTLAFGPDGYLYLAPGDGGNANDVGPSHIEPGGNAQNLTTPLGKVLRIDPIDPTPPSGPVPPPLNPGDATSGNGEYRIPADNPFQAAGQAKEIYAYGLRNPYRFAFDRGGTNDLILADVGQNNIEEINKIVRGGNYGWAVKEGTFLFNRTAGPGNVPPAGSIGANSPDLPAGLIDPIEGTPDPVTLERRFLQYDHGDGISITGGFVYRGTLIPELFGKYVFGDLAIRSGPRVDGRLFYADLQQGTINEFLIPQFADDQLPLGLTVHGFGEDGNGEIYAMVTNTPANGTGGFVLKFVPEPASGLILVGLGMTFAIRRRRVTPA
jgi:glucose/arabinose dehydrogenase